MPTYFHYNNLSDIAKSARVLNSKANKILGLLATPLDGSLKWFTTAAIVKASNEWRAAVNKYLQTFLDQNWVEQVNIANVPGTNEEEQIRKRNLWKLADDVVGMEYVFNNFLEGKIFDLGAFALNLQGPDLETKLRFENDQIAKAIEELGSQSTLNFLNAFSSSELYYQEAVEKLRSNDISCPKHEKLAKLCKVEFTRIGIDLERYKILDRKYSPDKSSGAPGFTYLLYHPGIRFSLRSTVKDLEVKLYQPNADDWKNSKLTAEQISTLREGVVVDLEKEMDV